MIEMTLRADNSYVDLEISNSTADCKNFMMLRAYRSKVFLISKINRCFIKFIWNIFREAAKCKNYLKLMGITHVLNTAEGKYFGLVDTDHLYYRDCPRIKYMGFPMVDHPSTKISTYFHISANFIHDAIASGGMFKSYICIDLLFDCNTSVCIWFLNRTLAH